MNLSWPHRAAGKGARRGGARAWAFGATAVAAAGAIALAAPAMSAMASTKHATTTKFSAVSGYVGSKITLTAKVTGSTPKGTVKFILGRTTLCSATLSNGTAKCGHVFRSAGSDRVEARYLGNSTHKTSSATATVKVLVKTTTKVSASPANARTGQAVKFTAVVSPSNATGTVTFSVGTTRLGSAKVSGGKATFTHTWTGTGSHTVIAAYGGDAKHAKSKGTTKVTVVGAFGTTTKITISVPGDPYSPSLNWEPAGPVEVPFTVTNNVAGGPAPTGTVTITDPVVPVFQPKPPQPPFFTGCSATLKPVAGTNHSTGECTVTTEGWGFVLMQATYKPGSATFAGSLTPITATYKIINLMNTATSVAPAAATAGTAVTLVASVVPAAPAAPPYDLLKGFSEQIENGPAGDTGDTVSFTANGTAIAGCQNVKIAWDATTQADVADCPYTPTAPGTVQIVATFSGDEYAATSTSPTDNLAVTG